MGGFLKEEKECWGEGYLERVGEGRGEREAVGF